jgi:hypothetical protein
MGTHRLVLLSPAVALLLGLAVLGCAENATEGVSPWSPVLAVAAPGPGEA